MVTATKNPVSSHRLGSKRSRLIDQFTEQISVKATSVGLSPDLPELTALARDNYKSSRQDYLLEQINPYNNISRDGDQLTVLWQAFSGVLRPTTIADFHLGRDTIRKRTASITVDHSTHFYDGAGTEIVCFQAGIARNPLTDDDGRGLHDAVNLIRYYTDSGINLHTMYGVISIRLEL